MVIDGFKSYGNRTEISGFDRLFNAITGLNGSGKSNILDSICFLLGITNLSQVRASNLQELVYKCGQGGVTKATVSVTFDNTDKKSSPMGYEQYEEITITRQVVIGGRNKYLINGCNATNNRVQDLFGSVQLNVNNPHFLIMQGRITKVLNMKPPEILSMIEEAAGTRMYESKKLAAQRTIEKKDEKLKEIDKMLKEDITPTLTKLKEERQAYVDYTKIVRELDHLTKLYVAWQFVQCQESWSKSKDDVKTIRNTITSHKEHIAEAQKNVKVLEENIKELERKKDEEAGGKLASLEEVLKEKKMAEAKINSQLQIKNNSLKEENKKIKELEKNCDEDKSSATSKQKELDKLLDKLNSLQEASKKDAEAVEAANKHFQAVSAGLCSNTEGEEATLANQLMSAQHEITQADTETKQAEMKLKIVREELTRKKKECASTAGNYEKDQAQYKELEKALTRLQAELNKLGNVDEKEGKLQAEKKRLVKEVEHLAEKIDVALSKFPNLTFDYVDPEKNFNRQKVHGLVCKLIKIKDPATATALEITAGGRLYNVVVDTEVTGKKLLDRGQLRRRYTIIPLNKIVGRPIENEVVKRAERLVGRDNVHTALSLVGYDRQVEAAMEYVFGGSFVCTDMDKAKAVTFADGIKKKSVTLDGEVFDPAGTLSGGAMSQKANILLKLSELKETEDELAVKRQNLWKLDQELQNITNAAQRYRNLKQQYELKSREAEYLKAGLQQSDHHKIMEEVQKLQESLEELQSTVTKCRDVKKKAEERVKDLQLKINDAKAVRERELKAAEKALKDCKKNAESSMKQAKVLQETVDALNLELEDIQKGLSNYQEQLQSGKDVCESLEREIAEISEELQKMQTSVAAASENVKSQKAMLEARSAEIKKLQKQREALLKEIEDTKLQIQQLEHDVSKREKESKDASEKVEYYLTNYEWIAEEKKFFGVPNTDYDFSANDPKEVGRRLQKLKEKKEKLSKNINTRAQNMISKAEDQYQDLIRKKRIVENDKAKISAVIKELDEKKNQALKGAWEKVNKDFGSIFETLLPGSKAKLVAPEGMTVLDGLEFKVAFGDVWKESLSELSGGQRSLVALSLILALLLFKPAPIYILDEVDAALDLSHTQNIGQMLKTHFKHSQFIIVSLKDGMFHNANVLFKTKFVDGVSHVTRILHKSLRTPSSAASKGQK